jgi:hypothetical protein
MSEIIFSGYSALAGSQKIFVIYRVQMNVNTSFQIYGNPHMIIFLAIMTRYPTPCSAQWGGGGGGAGPAALKFCLIKT